jgi:hypothetical protein
MSLSYFTSPGAFPVIPTAEIQICTFPVTDASGELADWDFLILGSANNKTTGQKTAAGMHLVFRYINRIRRYSDKPFGPPIRVTFPDEPTPSEIFVSGHCNCHPISSGIDLQPGEWVTLEVKRHIGIGSADGKGLSFNIDFPPRVSQPGTDGPEIIIQC